MTVTRPSVNVYQDFQQTLTSATPTLYPLIIGPRYDFLTYADDKLHSNFHAVVLGHSHIIQRHVFSINNEKRIYINPGSWLDNNTFLWYQEGCLQLCKFDGNNTEILFEFVF